MPNYTIGEPSEIPKQKRTTANTILFAEILDRLSQIDGLAIPVHFTTTTAAERCRAAVTIRRGMGSRFPQLKAIQRSDTVFFWLEKEVPDAPTT